MPRSSYAPKTSRSQGNKVLNSFIGSLGENSSTSYKLSTGGLLTISNATTSDLPSKISGSTASTGNKSLEVTQTTLSSFQSHPDSVPTAPSLGGTSLEIDLGDLARRALWIQNDAAKKDKTWDRMNELRIMMQLHGYRNLEFRKGKIFTSDDQWDEGLPVFSNQTNRYFTKLELNATRLLLILSLQKMGKTTEDSARAFLELMKSRVDPQADAKIARNENKWHEMQTRFQNIWARLKRYHELLLKCSVDARNAAPEGSKPRKPKSILTDKGKLAASLTSSSSHYMSQQSDVEPEPLPAPEITPVELKMKLQDRLCVTTKGDQQGHPWS
jgi:hypothetical protein